MVTDFPAVTETVLTVEGRVATLAMDRDDVRNELTGSGIIGDLVAVVDWINGGADIGALVLASTGKVFSAGGNVKHMRERSGLFAGDVYQQQDDYRSGIQRGALALDRLEVPSIAAVNGAAIGAGLDLAMMCDIRLAAEDTVFGETFLNLGLVPGDGGAWFLQRIVGYQRAAELAFSGRVIGAGEAHEIGLVLEVVAPASLAARAAELAASFATKPPRALRMTKRLLKSARRLELADFLDQSAVYQGMATRTEDHLEAVNAFFERREPVYTGR